MIFGEGFDIIKSLLKEVTTEYKMFRLGMRCKTAQRLRYAKRKYRRLHSMLFGTVNE